jgi:hypothetical protein
MGYARDTREHRKRLQRTLSCSLRNLKAPHWGWRVVPGPSLSADLSLCDPPREGIDLKHGVGSSPAHAHLMRESAFALSSHPLMISRGWPTVEAICRKL